MNVGEGFIGFRINFGAQVDGFTPASIPKITEVKIITSVASFPVAGEKNSFAVRRNGGVLVTEVLSVKG